MWIIRVVEVLFTSVKDTAGFFHALAIVRLAEINREIASLLLVREEAWDWAMEQCKFRVLMEGYVEEGRQEPEDP